MNPDLFQILDGLEGLGAAVRDEQCRLVWCNEAYAGLLARPGDPILGTRPADLMPPALARDRTDRIHRVLDDGRRHEFQQLLSGRRWRVRIAPIRHPPPGVFILLSQALDPAPDVPVSHAADLGDLAVLSQRELEVLHHLAEGKTVNEVAAALYRSPKTIGRHAENIHRKMDYANRAALVRDATRRGLTGFTPDQWDALIRRRPRARVPSPFKG